MHFKTFVETRRQHMLFSLCHLEWCLLHAGVTVYGRAAPLGLWVCTKIYRSSVHSCSQSSWDDNLAFGMSSTPTLWAAGGSDPSDSTVRVAGLILETLTWHQINTIQEEASPFVTVDHPCQTEPTAAVAPAVCNNALVQAFVCMQQVGRGQERVGGSGVSLLLYLCLHDRISNMVTNNGRLNVRRQQ